MGHVDDEMTDHYNHVRDERKLAAVRDLEGKVLSPVLSSAGTAPEVENKKPRKSGA